MCRGLLAFILLEMWRRAVVGVQPLEHRLTELTDSRVMVFQGSLVARCLCLAPADANDLLALLLVISALAAAAIAKPESRAHFSATVSPTRQPGLRALGLLVEKTVPRSSATRASWFHCRARSDGRP